MKPIGDQLLVKAEDVQDTTSSGIILGQEESLKYGIVMAAGPGLFTQTGTRIPMTCQPGDRILAATNLLSGKNGNSIKIDDEEYVLIREADVKMYGSES